MRRFLEWPPTPPEVAEWYGFPQMVNGAGQRIALIQLAGGCREDDLRACYNRYGVCMPAISFVSVDGAKNDPTGDPFDRDDREVLLDLVVAGSLAPGAHLVVYFAPNTDCGLLNAITTAVHDDMLRPSVISISWGGAEPSLAGRRARSYQWRTARGDVARHYRSVLVGGLRPGGIDL
jgi:kumamolisin